MGVAELQRAGLESGDTEQIIQHLHRELLEAQEMANTGKQRCLELQGNSRTKNPASAKGKKIDAAKSPKKMVNINDSKSVYLFWKKEDGFMRFLLP